MVWLGLGHCVAILKTGLTTLATTVVVTFGTGLGGTKGAVGAVWCPGARGKLGICCPVAQFPNAAAAALIEMCAN